MMEAVRTSETWVYSSENTRRFIPEGSNFLTFLKDFRIPIEGTENIRLAIKTVMGTCAL
jgi:hypothetical protein